MDHLKKILFIDVTSYHFGRQPTKHPEYLKIWQTFSEDERAVCAKLTNEIREVWSYINTSKAVPQKQRVSSIFEYDEKIKRVDSRILKLCEDYDLSLKEQLSEEFKAQARKVMGDEYSKWFED